jgi:DNA-binding NtrC family response regulator
MGKMVVGIFSRTFLPDQQWTADEFEFILLSDKGRLLKAVEAQTVDILILESIVEDIGLAELVRGRDKKVPIVVVTSSSSEEHAIRALRVGVNDYIRSPLSPEALRETIARCGHRTAPAVSVRDCAPCGLVDGGKIIGNSYAMRAIKEYVGKVAVTDTNVLITGETGTGKELIAELIHANSRRSHKPMVSVNCAALPDSLLESELFGYERGAFTGASASREGKIKFAEGGTVFFDEIGDMSPYAQAKILRLIESKEIQRLGDNRNVSLDVRFIAATNQDLERLTEEQKYRRDLYFRLNIARIHMPPLRSRKEDLCLLLDHYIQVFNNRYGRQVEGLTREALNCLLEYDWPGNIREVKNLLESVFVFISSSRITMDDLPAQFQLRVQNNEPAAVNERDRLLSALFSVNWNKSKAAEKLQWSRMTLYRKMEKHHIREMTRANAEPE